MTDGENRVPKIANEDFFKSPQGAAVLKHRLLGAYLPVFIAKTGKYSTGHRVGFIDGYAGPGQYLDETPGSPAIALETADGLSHIRNVECIFIEEAAQEYQQLAKLVAEHDLADNCRVLHGTAEDHLDRAVASLGDAPLLAFLDPYSLLVPFEQLVGTLLHRPRGIGWSRTHITEVMFNFGMSAVRRFAGFLDRGFSRSTNQKQAATLTAKLDEFLGGDWWQEVYREHRAGAYEQEILSGYLRRLVAAAGSGWGWMVIDVSDTYRGAPAYQLGLLTQHPDGLWAFNEAASHGVDALRDWSEQQSGQLELSGVSDVDADRVATIKENIRSALKVEGKFAIRQQVGNVFGDVLGEARGTHVRRALKELYDSGELADKVVGVKRIETYQVRRPS
jgi:three-Cys-motif partner protein